MPWARTPRSSDVLLITRAERLRDARLIDRLIASVHEPRHAQRRRIEPGLAREQGLLELAALHHLELAVVVGRRPRAPRPRKAAHLIEIGDRVEQIVVRRVLVGAELVGLVPEIVERLARVERVNLAALPRRLPTADPHALRHPRVPLELD